MAAQQASLNAVCVLRGEGPVKGIVYLTQEVILLQKNISYRYFYN